MSLLHDQSYGRSGSVPMRARISQPVGYSGARIFDGETWHENSVLVIEGSLIEGIVDGVPTWATKIELAGGILAPGYVDLQVNGGDGLLIGAGTTYSDLERICSTHAEFGVTSLLPTLITDKPEATNHIIDIAVEAARNRLSGFLGLHLEGPHISVARKGAHDPALIRPITEMDLTLLENLRPLLPYLLITVAAETVTPEQIARLVRGGIKVSIGHSDATYEVTAAALRAGASMATHLFNAMSPIGNRDSGVVGAVLDHGSVFASLIGDGIHVAPATIGIALRAKKTPARIFLVSDAMALAGSDLNSFLLNGRTVTRKDGALRLDDGTLAGADLTLDHAVTFIHRTMGLPLSEALRMASSFPAEAIGAGTERGYLRRGYVADFIHLTKDLTVSKTWIAGNNQRNFIRGR